MVVYKRYEEEYGYNQGIPVPDRFYLSLLNCVSIDDYKTTLDHYPQHFAPDGLNSEMNYKVSLPTTVQIKADYSLQDRFYLNADLQLAMTCKGQYNSNF
ncbi:hypothetical protein SIO70_31675 [Chitinophaga sancti]|uniref:hypothetical protein n=1 Tax=Chitinophaga sancti TaxID=1004 RepID=UPI002A75D841|nr:hypothetical protein [Chitinophaga sancti]WPQ62925.1 hypothetical protein SIO70_31675 [Chitinophaga sancti]